MSHGKLTSTAPTPPGSVTPPGRFLALDFPESAAPGRGPLPPLGSPAFLPPPGLGPGGAAATESTATAPGAATRSARRRLSPRKRRIIEVIALASVLPLTLGLQWVDEVRLIQLNLEPAETITVVPRDGTANMAHSRWTMGGRLPSSDRSLGTKPPSGATTITLVIGVKALDAQGTKEASSANLKFRLVDRAGREWEASADYQGDDVVTGPPVGKVVPIHVTCDVPTSLAGEVVLDVVQSGAYRPKGRPAPVLRFAH